MSQRINLLPSQARTAGEYAWPERVLNPNVARIKLTASREAWPVGLAVSVSMDFSPDGINWISPYFAFSSDGGDYIGRDGTVSPESSIEMDIPGEGNPGRKVRGQVTYHQDLRSGIDIETFTADEIVNRGTRVR